MAQFRVGCVPYVNARPLVAAFDQPNDFVEVIYEVPSKLPALLDSGEVDAILVSSIELLRRNDLLMVADVGIMSYGPVKSVRLLSKVPLTEIKSLALDQSSMTSNILAQIILAENGVFPICDTVPPDQSNMLDSHDACVIIGDNGFKADGTGLVDIDLGEAWTDMTGLPFVWALWLGKKDHRLDAQKLSVSLYLAFEASGFNSIHSSLDLERPILSRVKRLRKELTHETLRKEVKSDEPRRKYVCETAAKNSGWTPEEAMEYLTNNVRYKFLDSRKGLGTFKKLIEKHSLGKICPAEPNYLEMRKEIYGLIPS